MYGLMETPIEMDDLGGKPTIFENIHIRCSIAKPAGPILCEPAFVSLQESSLIWNNSMDISYGTWHSMWVWYQPPSNTTIDSVYKHFFTQLMSRQSHWVLLTHIYGWRSKFPV